jgi:tetratricopeptide (TPR) repeat protein
MAMARVARFFAPVVALAAVVAVLGLSRLAPAADDNSVRKQIIKLNDVTGDDAISGKILELLEDKAALRKLVGEAAKLAKEKDHPLTYNGAYILAQASQGIKDYASSEVFYKVCAEQAVKLQSGQKLAQTLEGLIDLFDRTKRFDDALRACQEFLELPSREKNIERVKPFVLEKMILVLTKQGKFDDALKLSDKMIEADEGGWYFVRLKAEVLRESGKLDESAKEFEDALEKLDKAKKLEDDTKARYKEALRYSLSGVYTDANKIDKAVEVLRGLLKDKPESASYHNDLGYIMADHDMNLDEAEKLIRKALDLDKEARKKLRDEGKLDPEYDKDNSAYLDSLGWVLFKKKNYTEAKKYFLEAVKDEDAQHVEIYDHLAEVYAAAGEKDKAVETWKKALSLENLGKRDEARKEEVKKKLASNQ